MKNPQKTKKSEIAKAKAMAKTKPEKVTFEYQGKILRILKRAHRGGLDLEYYSTYLTKQEGLEKKVELEKNGEHIIFVHFQKPFEVWVAFKDVTPKKD